MLKARTYLVWEVEYGEEGSTEVRALSPAHAKKIYRAGDEALELGACLLTPKLKKERETRLKASVGGLLCSVCQEDATRCRCKAFALPRSRK